VIEVRNTVTISFSCKPETYKKIMEVKEGIEAERLDTIPISQVIDRLINLGFVYREKLSLEKQEKEVLKQQKLAEINQTLRIR
jgi:hypothetical protein